MKLKYSWLGLRQTLQTITQISGFIVIIDVYRHTKNSKQRESANENKSGKCPSLLPSKHAQMPLLPGI